MVDLLIVVSGMLCLSYFFGRSPFGFGLGERYRDDGAAEFVQIRWGALFTPNGDAMFCLARLVAAFRGATWVVSSCF
ncbi:hypothetical protein [Nocardia brasiliensis]|uniref:hypothetical protein n=1 Tax=Nocardia brasiliensis TaxID=37326 RepID=UPI00245715E0|nr:hypothetical protein [Nocardia brasiliensis]